MTLSVIINTIYIITIVLVSGGNKYCCSIVLQNANRSKQYAEVIPGQLANLEKILESNDGGDGFMAGKKVLIYY